MEEEQVATLAALPEQEWRVSVLRLIGRIQDQVDANTEITADTQEILNRDVIDKMAQITAVSEKVDALGERVDAMYRVFDTTRNGFRMLGAVGNGVMKIADAIYKHGRPLFWIVAVGAAIVAWWKTGKLEWPTWWLK